MRFTTLSVRTDVMKRLKAAKQKGESYSDVLERLLENEPAMTVGEFLESLKPLEGKGAFSPEGREALRKRHLPRRKRRVAA